MNLNRNELGFLIYFLPLFVLKLLNVTAESIWLKLLGLLCVVLVIPFVLCEKYSLKLFWFYSLQLIFTAILFFTCGKQGLFFSALMLLIMKGINMHKHIYKYCFVVGAIAFIMACIMSKEGSETLRYVNGEWVSMFKRNNILYVSYIALVCLYVFIHKGILCNKQLLMIAISGYGVYLYVGSNRISCDELLLDVCFDTSELEYKPTKRSEI